ncbi:MAG: septum formation initiator family protein [Bacteroidota bacterium]|jgi:cell division protein FtsB
MDEQYYRKKPANPHVPGWLKGILKNKRLNITLLILIPTLSFMTFSNKGILQRVRLESEKRAMQEKILQAQREQNQLLQQSKALDSDPKTIEKVAREKYGMIRDGETVYKVKKEK